MYLIPLLLLQDYRQYLAYGSLEQQFLGYTFVIWFMTGWLVSYGLAYTLMGWKYSKNPDYSIDKPHAEDFILPKVLFIALISIFYFSIFFIGYFFWS